MPGRDLDATDTHEAWITSGQRKLLRPRVTHVPGCTEERGGFEEERTYPRSEDLKESPG